VPDDSAYGRGIAAGEVAQRLHDHDKHFDEINGSIKELIGEVHGMRLDVQRLGDAAESDRATVITTATALEKAAQARRDTSESRWSPMAKTIAVIGVIATVVAAVSAVIYGLTGR
jgi:hypothetical protein